MRPIRPTARCIFRRNNQVMLVHVYDPDYHDGAFLVPTGGGIDFGEHSKVAAIREAMEETGQEVTNLQLLGVIENIFTVNNGDHHELVFVYEADFVDQKIYDLEEIPVVESNGMKFAARWYDLAWLKEEHMPVYPTSILDILQR
ncbi:MAG: NUDIX domain-containing protein [Chloroflexota bacterium]